MTDLRRSRLAVACCVSLLAASAPAVEVELNGKRFALPDGLTIELAAAAPLTERPICVDFDEEGRLYVAESSGTNDNVQKQLAEKPHSILRLEDSDGDGLFDRRTVFADGMMFPEGCEWHDGSLYVGAPPHIWKLTDTDDDGVADQREVWFDGKTLTGCANDLHGPYVGLDGLIYWCKGAFAEQTHERPGKAPFVTKASHIFRHDPRTGTVEPVLTGGMDNPVEVAFSRDGEAFLSCTFLQHPAGGNRDGLIHAVYGGVWGKDHGVVDGHPRTGELMPPLARLGAAAPCGLARVEGSGMRVEGRSASLDSRSSIRDPDVLLACSFNLHQVSRHVLRPEGGTYATADDVLVSCDDVDFHPTDVIEDADESLLVVDTGGWYKLCCPTSQLHKPEVSGAIYRIRRTGSERSADPRGLGLEWPAASNSDLVSRFHDGRFAVRRRALDEIAKRGAGAVPELGHILHDDGSGEARRLAVWTLTRIGHPDAREAVRGAFGDSDLVVRRSAIRSAGLWRDTKAASELRPFLRDGDAHTRRVAAEALGRIGDREAVPELLTAAGAADGDRFLHHAMTFALIEIADPGATRTGLAGTTAGTVRAALFALGQMPGGDLAPQEVLERLDSPDEAVRDASAWLIEYRPDWAEATAEHLAGRLRRGDVSDEQAKTLGPLLARFAARPSVRDLIPVLLRDEAVPREGRKLLLAAMSGKAKTLPAGWGESLAGVLNAGDPTEIALAVEAVAAVEKFGDAADLRDALRRVAGSNDLPGELRVRALRTAGGEPEVNDHVFEFLLARLTEPSTTVRLAAADVLSAAKLSGDQLRRVAETLPELGPMELARVLPAFAKATDSAVGLTLSESLHDSPSAGDLPPDALSSAFAKFGPDVKAAARSLLERPQADEAERRARLDEFVASAGAGDPARGHAIFQSSKAACSACHAVGFLGGRIGPDLTGISKIRTDRDLLEAILFPSASFVRSYEPVVVVTADGQVHTGVPREDRDGVTLTTAADKTVSIPHEEIEEMRPSTVSIMPAGLEKQLRPQELADLIAFLKAAK